MEDSGRDSVSRAEVHTCPASFDHVQTSAHVCPAALEPVPQCHWPTGAKGRSSLPSYTLSPLSPKGAIPLDPEFSP